MSLGAPRPAARPPANTAPAPEVSTVTTSAPDAPSPATVRARRPQRRGTSTGRHWEEAANLFVKEIPPVKCFSDTRPVPMRDVRGWIDTIGQQAHNLVWVALMRSLTQADLDESGDKEICRYILACVIVEERHPDTEKRQTRQAVNNAIKRELMCPRANGRSARGKTFRELFRDKAVECGFRVAPAEESQPSQHPQPTESTSSQPAVLRPLTPRADTSAPQTGTARTANGHGPNSRSGKTPVKKGDMDLIPVPEHSHRSKRPRSDLYTDEPPGGLEVIARAVEMNGVNSLSGTNLDKLQPTADGRIPFWELGPLEALKVEKALVLKGKLAIFKDLLQDFRWIHGRVMENESGLRNLVRSGYDVLLSCERGLTDPEWEGFRLIRNCLMLIRPVIEPELHAVLVRKRPVRAGLRAQLASQLYGRLLEPSRKFSVISTLLESIRQYAGRPWLRPLNPCLEAPFTDIAMAFHSGPDALPSAVAISHDGELVLTSGEDSKCVDQHSTSYGMQRGSRQMQSYSVRVWRVDSGECVCSITGHSSSVMHLGITRDKSHVVSSSSALSTDPLKFWKIRDRNGLYIERVTTGIAARTQNTMVFSIALLPDNKHVIAGTGSASGRGAIRMWNITTGEHVAEFDGRIGTPFGLDVTPDGSFLVSGDTDGMISLWDISLKKKTFSIENQSSTRGTVASEQEMQQGGHDPLRDPTQKAAVFSVCFVLDRQFAITPRQLLIAAGDQSCIRIWSLKQSMDVDSLPFQSTSSEYDYEPVYVLRSGLSSNMGPMCNVTRIQSAGEGTLFSGSGDGSTRMWKLLGEKKYQAVRLGTDLQQSAVPGTRRNSLRGSVFVAASDDGKRVASSTERSLVPVWDIERYERALERNKQLYRSYFVYTPGSVSFTDMLSPSYGMPQSQYYPPMDYRNSDSGLVDEYFLVVDIGSDMQFVTKSGPARNEVTVTLTFQGASSQDLYLAFDDHVAENVNRNQLRGGTFLRPTVAGEEPFDDAELTQKGVVVRLRDGSLGFFELERHIPSKAEAK